MATYVPRAFHGPEDPFDAEFNRLSEKKRDFQRWTRAGFGLGIISYFLFVPSLFYLNSLPIEAYLKAGAGLLVVLAFISAVLFVRHSRKYSLTREESGFIEVFLARKDVEAHAKDPQEEARLNQAKLRLRRVTIAVPTARPVSTLATRALQGTGELRDFIRKKLLVYLDAPIETSRVIDSLGILAQFLLNPTMESLPFTLDQLNDTIPDSLVPTRVGLGHRAQRMVMVVWENTISQRPFYSALLTALATSSIVFAVSLLLGAPSYQGFGFSVSAFLLTFYEAYNLFKEQSSSSK